MAGLFDVLVKADYNAMTLRHKEEIASGKITAEQAQKEEKEYAAFVNEIHKEAEAIDWEEYKRQYDAELTAKKTTRKE